MWLFASHKRESDTMIQSQWPSRPWGRSMAVNGGSVSKKCTAQPVLVSHFPSQADRSIRRTYALRSVLYKYPQEINKCQCTCAFPSDILLPSCCADRTYWESGISSWLPVLLEGDGNKMLLRQGREGSNSFTRIWVCLFIDAHTHTELCRKLETNLFLPWNWRG